MRTVLLRCFLLAATIAWLTAAAGLPLYAEGVEVPPFVDLVHHSSVYVVTPVRLGVLNSDTPRLGGTSRTTWHVFRIEESLSRHASGATACRRRESTLAVSNGEIALPFPGEGGESSFPSDWDRLPLTIGRRYLALVADCGEGIGNFRFGPAEFFEIAANGALARPGAPLGDGSIFDARFDSLDKVKQLITDLAQADADQPPSGILVGRTVDALTGSAVGNARLLLQGVTERVTSSTADGWFFFRDLPAFQYAFEVSKDGWFIDPADIAERRVKLTSGERRDDVLLRLHRAPLIEGSVHDEAGRPLVAVEVMTLQVRDDSGVRSISKTWSSRTDDRGHFTLAVVPGDYLVGARVNPLPGADPVTVVGHSHYPLTYYPSAVALSQATVVTLRANGVSPGIDIEVRPMAARRIAGTVSSADRPAPGIALRLDRDEPGIENRSPVGGISSFGGRTGNDGSFAFDNLLAGRYTVSAILSGEPQDKWVRRVVTVGERDADGVTLSLTNAYRVTTPTPGNPVTAVAQRGTARVVIVVHDQDDGRPLNRTLVTLTNVVTQQARKSETDPDGRVEFAGLVPGRYTITPARAGYVAIEGAALPSAERTIEVSGDAPAKLDLPMSRGGVITGVVVDERGQPVKGATVLARRYEARSGAAPLVRSNGYTPVGGISSAGATDDRGQYRIFGVPPGDYLISAQLPQIVDTFQAPSAEDVARVRDDVRASRSAPSGEAGRMAVAAGATSAAVAARRPSVTRPLEVFYPSTTDPLQATVIHMTAATESSGREIQLVTAYPVNVNGTFRFEPAGIRANVTVSLVRTDIEIGTGGFVSALEGKLAASNVAQGRYALIGRTAASPRDPDTYLWGRTDIQVGADDVDNVELVLGPTASLQVRVVAGAGGVSLGPNPIMLTMEPVESVLISSASVGGRVGSDGTVSLMGLARGRYRFTVSAGSNVPIPWIVQSASVDGVALPDGVVEVTRPGPLGEVLIRLGTR